MTSGGPPPAADPLREAAEILAAWGVVESDAASALSAARTRCAAAGPGQRWIARGASLDALVAAAAGAEVIAVDPSEFLERLGDALGLPLVAEEEDTAARLGPYHHALEGRPLAAPVWGTTPADGPVSGSGDGPSAGPGDAAAAARIWTPLGEGGDAVAWRRGDQVVRFARHPALIPGLQREHQLLERLAARVGNVPRSEGVLVSARSAASVQRFCPGRPATRAVAAALGPTLGSWLGRVHSLTNPPRRFDTAPAALLARLRLQVAVEGARRGWPGGSTAPFGLPGGLAERIDTFLATPPPPAGRMTLIHGDLTPEHVLVDDQGRLAAVLDWMDAGGGDPERDLGYLAAWGGEALLQSVLRHYPHARSPEDDARLWFHRRRAAVVFLWDGLEGHDPVACASEAFDA